VLGKVGAFVSVLEAIENRDILVKNLLDRLLEQQASSDELAQLEPLVRKDSDEDFVDLWRYLNRRPNVPMRFRKVVEARWNMQNKSWRMYYLLTEEIEKQGLRNLKSDETPSERWRIHASSGYKMCYRFEYDEDKSDRLLVKKKGFLGVFWSKELLKLKVGDSCDLKQAAEQAVKITMQLQ
jgi:hypothetical protein